METVRITLEIDCADPLHGTIDEPDQPRRTFSGWTAFATVMDAAVRRMDGGEGSALGDGEEVM